MLKFDLSKMVKAPRAKLTIKLRPITPSLGLEVQYERTLKRMLGEVAKFVSGVVLPAADGERSLLTTDAAGDRLRLVFQRLEALMRRLTGSAQTMANDILGLAADRHTADWLQRTRAQLGIDLRGIISRADLTDALSLAAQRNADLITKLGTDTTSRISAAVIENLTTGGTQKMLREKLTEDFKIMGNRAKLIGRDQMSKLNGDLNRLRQTQSGIDSYEWSTSGDERVRPSHRENDGEIFKWDDPPEDTGHPGHDINCRCSALAIVDFSKG